jgi:hypothetical protein
MASSQVGRSGKALKRLRVGVEDAAIVPLVATMLLVRKVAEAALTLLINFIDFLFPVLLQLTRFPLFTLRALGDGTAALLRGVVRFLPVGSNRRAAWRAFIGAYWAWLRERFSYQAFEHALHCWFESGMAWVFRTCRTLTPAAALLVILGAVLWLPVSFGAATLLHATLIAKAASLPPWMQLLHPVATIIAKSKLLVLPAYPAAWPQARQHGFVQAIFALRDRVASLFVVRKARLRYRELASAARKAAAAFELVRFVDLLLAMLDHVAAATGRALRAVLGGTVMLLAKLPVIGAIVRHYAERYEQAQQRPAALLSSRVSGFYSRWSIKFSAEYYEAKEREEAAGKGLSTKEPQYDPTRVRHSTATHHARSTSGARDALP